MHLSSSALGIAFTLVLPFQDALAQGFWHPMIGVGAGLARSTVLVGDTSSASRSGLLFHASVGILEIAYQPFATPHPDGTEQLTALWVLVGPRFRVAGYLDLRPQVGAQFSWWSGSNPVGFNNPGLAVGMVAGHDVALRSGWLLAPQVLWRLSVMEGHGGAADEVLGVRVECKHRL
jgi:hypothetical protein